jgi:hypothetical protein
MNCVILCICLFYVLFDILQEEQRKLRDSGERSSTGGAVLLVVLVVSLVGTVLLNVILIWA